MMRVMTLVLIIKVKAIRVLVKEVLEEKSGRKREKVEVFMMMLILQNRLIEAIRERDRKSSEYYLNNICIIF